MDSWTESDGRRDVFKFRLEAIEADEGNLPSEDVTIAHEVPRNRVIPSHIKQEVWKRNNGRCILCGSADELHFDHVLPFSRGGTSLTASNVQLLCARHNLQKSAKIE
ncbi:MAG: HNH endonuclease [Hyphomicrobiales bacterium]